MLAAHDRVNVYDARCSPLIGPVHQDDVGGHEYPSSFLPPSRLREAGIAFAPFRARCYQPQSPVLYIASPSEPTTPPAHALSPLLLLLGPVRPAKGPGSKSPGSLYAV